MLIHLKEIEQLEKDYRTAFINSLAGYRQAVLVGTKSPEGKSNLAIFNSLIHLGANPALYGLLSRPTTVQRDTLSNILSTKEYTLNYINAVDFEKAHQTSARYPANASEFHAVGFTEEYVGGHQAPFVKESQVKIAMRLEETIDIKINGTILIIGSIQHVEIIDSLVGADGFVALSEANVLASSGLDAYFSPQFLGRLSYAKPDKWPSLL